MLSPGYLDVPNHIPESSGITTVDMVSYFLFWLIQLPFFFINSNHLRYAFILKVFVVPATAIAMTVSIAKDAGGSGPLVRAPSTISGRDYSLAFLTGLGAVIGNWSTLALNSPGQFSLSQLFHLLAETNFELSIPDFARYSKKPNSQLVQAVAIPATAIFIGVCGIICGELETLLEINFQRLKLISLCISSSFRFGRSLRR